LTRRPLQVAMAGTGQPIYRRRLKILAAARRAGCAAGCAKDCTGSASVFLKLETAELLAPVGWHLAGLELAYELEE
jgi:hypothetical protein